MTMPGRRMQLALAALVLAGWPGASCRAGDTWGSWTATWENDSFAFFTGSDEYYTNGVRLTVARDPDARWDWARDLGDEFGRLGWTGVDVPETSTSLVIGQNLYTPEIITTFDVNPLDRPYAAWLYGGLRVDVTGRDSPVVHAFEVDLGVIGPPALGRQTQTGVHTLRHSRIPKGWSHQIPTALAISGLYDVRRRFGSSHADAVVGGGLVLGTVQVYPTAGATVRLGHHISGMPVALIAPTAQARPARSKFEIYGFAGFDGRAVLYNVFLDGNPVGGGPSVDSHVWVYDIRFGASVRLSTWRLTYTFVRRSEEFTPPPGRAEGLHDFGSIAVSYEQPSL